jgi:ectoine hydroxylase-related dioxygenase (phytanoyl-CoA dioxygenase family)
MVSTTRLSCSEALLNTSSDIGIKMPLIMHSYNLRMDIPNDENYLFHWHQDITYLLGSLNSVTYWIPLTKVDAYRGSIEVIPGSHKFGIYPHCYTGSNEPQADKIMSPSDIKLIDEPKSKSIVIDADVGDVIVFSQFLLHRSTFNHSKEIRWVAQIRHSDFFEDGFLDAGYPLGDQINIFNSNYLKDV